MSLEDLQNQFNQSRGFLDKVSPYGIEPDFEEMQRNVEEALEQRDKENKKQQKIETNRFYAALLVGIAALIVASISLKIQYTQYIKEKTPINIVQPKSQTEPLDFPKKNILGKKDSIEKRDTLK